MYTHIYQNQQAKDMTFKSALQTELTKIIKLEIVLKINLQRV